MIPYLMFLSNENNYQMLARKFQRQIVLMSGKLIQKSRKKIKKKRWKMLERVYKEQRNQSLVESLIILYTQ